MRIFADCCVAGIKYLSPDYYWSGSWDRVQGAAEVIRGRIRGDVDVLENRPGELRICWTAEGTSVHEVLAEALLQIETWTDGVAELYEISVENPAIMWYPNGDEVQNEPGEE